MKPEKIFNSSLEKSSIGKTGTTRKNHLEEKNRTFTIKETFPATGNQQKTSLIPKLKTNNNEAKGVDLKVVKPLKPTKINNTSSAISSRNRVSSSHQKPQKPVEDKKPKLNDIPNKKSQKKQEPQSQPSSQKVRVRQPNTTDTVRRMTSDPQIFRKIPIEGEILLNFENSVREISEVWLKTSADLCEALKILKNNPSADPIEFQQESVKIQMAIQQAKSLTILKTKSVMAEARMLLHKREVIESDLEYLLLNETPRSDMESCSLSENSNESHVKPAESQKFGGMGDLPQRREKSGECYKEIDGDNFEDENSGSQTTRIEKKDSFLVRKADKMSGNFKDSDLANDTITLEQLSQELIIELAKKNETITHLNNKIFQLQKTCEEYLQLRNYLQIKLTEYHEKVQWNHVLWKQIGKLKARIKEFQESHENLDSEKKALEMRIRNQEKEIERMNKMNHLLNQKRFLLSEQESFRGEKIEGQETGEWEKKKGSEKSLVDQKILEEKQNSINVLKMVLNVMMDQENSAQKQIAVFQSKIEELEKDVKI